MDRFRDESSDLFSLEIDETAKSTFLEMARWTKFLALLGFIMMGLFMVGGIFVASMINSFPSTSPFAVFGATGTVVYFIFIIGLMFYPILALFKFSTGVKTGLQSADKLQFNNAIRSLKNAFKYWGIMTIVFLGLYGVVIIGAIMVGLLNK